MPRRPPADPMSDAARSVLVEGERVLELGHCWGAQRRRRVPLVLARRNQYLMVLTDRRLLLFTRRPGPVHAGDLVIGKRYESFKLEKVRRARPLLQVRVKASSGTRMVFEFRPGRRPLGHALANRLTRRPPRAALPPGPVPAAGAPPAEGPETTGAEVPDAAFWGASARRP